MFFTSFLYENECTFKLCPVSQHSVLLKWSVRYPFSKVGFKPAGGIRSAKDALIWLSLMKEELGDEWLKPDLFRLGASTLLADIERQVSLGAMMQ